MAVYDIKGVFTSVEALDEDMRAELPSPIAQRLTAQWPSVFAYFGTHLPLTLDALTKLYEPPKIFVQKTITKNKHFFSLIMNGQTDLCCDFWGKSYYEQNHDDYLQGLPPALQDYYREVKNILPMEDPEHIPSHGNGFPLQITQVIEARHLRKTSGWSWDAVNRVRDSEAEIWAVDKSRTSILVDRSNASILLAFKADPGVLHPVRDANALWDAYCAHVFQHGSEPPFDFQPFL